MKQIEKYQQGQALIIITFAMISMIALVGLAIDGGRAFSDHRHAQNTADSAAYAAALAHVSDPLHNTDLVLAGKNIALENGYDSNLVTNTVTITTSPSTSGCPAPTGPGVDNLDIRIDIESHVGTTFAKVIGIQQLTNRVYSTARACDLSTKGPLYSGSSVFTTQTEACGNGVTDKNLWVQGSAEVKMYGGDLGSASTDGNCIYFKNGETSLKFDDTGTNCAQLITAAPASEASDADTSGIEERCGTDQYGVTFDPPPADLGITCDHAVTYPGSNRMGPGSFTGVFPPAGITTLDPGIYCINGDFKANAGDQLTGNGVTIVMNSGLVSWNGGAEIKLSAPTSGSWRGLLIYLPPGNSSDVTINGNSNSIISGTFLAQNSDCYYSGSETLPRQVVQFICKTWGVNGKGTVEIEYDSNKFYTPYTDPSIILLE